MQSKKSSQKIQSKNPVKKIQSKNSVKKSSQKCEASKSKLEICESIHVDVNVGTFRNPHRFSLPLVKFQPEISDRQTGRNPWRKSGRHWWLKMSSSWTRVPVDVHDGQRHTPQMVPPRQSLQFHENSPVKSQYKVQTVAQLNGQDYNASNSEADRTLSGLTSPCLPACFFPIYLLPLDFD